MEASTSLDFVTLAGNTAQDGAGGGLFTLGGQTAFTVHDTIVSDNTGGNCAPTATTPGRVFRSLGYNLESANDCSFGQTGDQPNEAPGLGGLASAGGPTETMALTATSPAVDAADPRCDVTSDQRGVSRPQGARCDIGAFELQAAPPPSPTALPLPPATGQGPAGGMDWRLPLAGLGIALLLACLVAGLGLRRRSV